jgi:hypothetical protein
MGALLTVPAVVRAEEPPAVGVRISNEARPGEPGKRVEILVRDPNTGFPANPEAVKAEVAQLEAALRLKQAELHQLEARLEQARVRVQQKAPAKVEGKILWATPDGEKRVIILGDGPLQAKPGAAVNITTASKGNLYELVEGEKGTLILRPVAQPNPDLVRIRVGADSVNPSVLVRPASTPGQPGWQVERLGGADKHTKDLEKRLDELARELEQLRKELKAPRAPTPKLELKPKPQEEPDEVRKLHELRLKQAELNRTVELLQKAVEPRKP